MWFNACMFTHTEWGHALFLLAASELGDCTQWVLQSLLPAEDTTDVDLHTFPASCTLMRLAGSAGRDAYLMQASSRARGAGPSKSTGDKSRKGKCQSSPDGNRTTNRLCCSFSSYSDKRVAGFTSHNGCGYADGNYVLMKDFKPCSV